MKASATRLLSPPWLMLGAAIIYVAALGGPSGVLAPVDLGHVFNSMLVHLLHGRFDVDPSAVGAEGFARHGHVYSYFGIMLALLRLPLWLAGALGRDVTGLSCLVASLAFVGCVAAAARTAHRAAGASEGVAAVLAIAILFGPAYAFLRPSIYQEVVDWASALAAWFVLLAVRGLLDEDGWTTRRLCWMAVAAGLALSTRVSTAIGLYAALGLLLLRLAWLERASWRGLARRFPIPVVILLVFAAVAAAVNVGRWGNPLTFANFSDYIWTKDYDPHRLVIEGRGLFSLDRLWLGVLYYWFPIGAVVGPGGQFLLHGPMSYWVESAEFPPSTFLLSDPLLLFLAIARWRAGAGVRLGPGGGMLLAGLAVPPVLMMMAVSMTFRYRMEFYPLFYLAAWLGLIRLGDRKWVSLVAVPLMIVGVAANVVLLFVYQRVPFGPPLPDWYAAFGRALRPLFGG